MDDDEIEFLYGLSDEEIRAEIARRARTEGIIEAYRSAIAICRDPKAPAQAKSASQRTLLQIGGMLDRGDRDEQRQKSFHEMSNAELTAELERFKSRRENAQRDPFEGGLFD